MRKILILILFCQALFAHKINLFTTYEDGQLFISSYFANGNGCKNCDIKIMDTTEKLIQKAKTDNNGEFSLKIEQQNLIVEIEAGEGHKVTKTLNLLDSKIEKNQATKENNDNQEFNKLKEENRKLKIKIEILEDKLDYLNFAKTIFGLLIIVFIFLFIKKIKNKNE